MRETWIRTITEVADKEISEIKILNSVPKNTKDVGKNTKTIIHLRLGDYRGIFPDNDLSYIITAL
jgi:hypothetical protein